MNMSQKEKVKDETMSKRKWIVIVCLLTVMLLCGVAVIFGWMRPSLPAYADADGVQMKFKTEGTEFQVYDEHGNWQTMFAKGVNLGATVPGHFPGEMPIREEDYLRWFRQIDEMGANVIRIYTVHNPVFYKALVKYNHDKGEDALYFMQGIWSPEEQLIERQDAYDPEIVEMFKQEIEKAVAAVYGDITLEEKKGSASGKYTVNAGKYLMAWHIGTEWDPAMVDNTNRLHEDMPRYEGAYFSAVEGASPFESWLASMLDHTAAAERKYGWEHPITFTNWVTTDVLEHPGEPLFEEDMVSVDARHVQPVDWEAGYFASYHVYPYYPDFFRTDETLWTIPDDKGGYNTYKAYLRRLKAEFTDMPIMVTEYGVPSSIGISHYGPGGRDQGGHDEIEQGKVNVSLTEDIYEEGYSGAILFMWQDEWFKKHGIRCRLKFPMTGVHSGSMCSPMKRCSACWPCSPARMGISSLTAICPTGTSFPRRRCSYGAERRQAFAACVSPMTKLTCISAWSWSSPLIRSGPDYSSVPTPLRAGTCLRRSWAESGWTAEASRL